MLTRLAQQASVAEQDVIGLLRAYGRDVAGALQIWDPDVPGEPKEPALEALSSTGVASMLEHVQDNPLGNKPSGGKTSLAGVQDKIVLARTESGWNRVIDGWPSTHILKPGSRDYPTSIYDEEFGARFARAVDLTSFPTWIEEFTGVPAVVIERYDRSPDAPQGRIHQEDFNQVLGAAGNQRGGRPRRGNPHHRSPTGEHPDPHKRSCTLPPGLTRDISRFTSNLLAGRATGVSHHNR